MNKPAAVDYNAPDVLDTHDEPDDHPDDADANSCAGVAPLALTSFDFGFRQDEPGRFTESNGVSGRKHPVPADRRFAGAQIPSEAGMAAACDQQSDA